MVDQSTLWLQYLDQVNSVVALKPGEGLQAIYPFQPWDWGGQSPVLNSYSYEQWSALNVVPSTPYLNSNSSPASQSGFDTGYGNWMNTLAIGDLAKDAHYQALQQQYSAALNKQQTDANNIRDVWQNQTGGVGETLAQWMADPMNASYAQQLAADELATSGLFEQLQNYQTQIESPLADVIAAFSDASFQTTVTDSNSGKPVQVRIWGTDPSTPWAYLQEVTGQNFGGDAVNGNPRSFSLKETTDSYDYSQVATEGGGGIWDDFIGIGAEGSFEKVDWSTFESQYSIEMSFQDLTTVAVNPDAWYQGSSVASFAKGPYATGFSEFDAAGDNYFFGVGGALSRVYTALVVAYRPKVVITAGSEFASYMHDQWQAKIGIEIGPFFFGHEASGEDTSSSASVDGASLTLESNSNWPVIVAMKSAWTVAPSE